MHEGVSIKKHCWLFTLANLMGQRKQKEMSTIHTSKFDCHKIYLVKPPGGVNMQH